MAIIRLGANRALDPLIENGGTSSFAHLYLTLADDSGQNQLITSLDDYSVEASTWPVKWKINQNSTPWEDSNEFEDSREPTQDTAEIPIDLGGRNAEDVWSVITQIALEFQRHTIDYRFLHSNSNMFASSLLYMVGIELGPNPVPTFLPGVSLNGAEVDGEFPSGLFFIPDPDIKAMGNKFTGIFGTRSAHADVTVFGFDIGDVDVPPDGPGNVQFDFTLVGTGNKDIIRGLRGNDLFLGGAGDDALIGGGGRDALQGGADNDHLFGGPGGDVLIGGAGDDYFDSGVGFDILVGGPGRDIFTSFEGTGIDLITDFVRGEDQIWVFSLEQPTVSPPTDFFLFGPGVSVRAGRDLILAQNVSELAIGSDILLVDPGAPPIGTVSGEIFYA